MAPAVYGAIRVAVIGTAMNQTVVNVFNVSGIGSPMAAAEAVGEAFAEAFKPLLSSTYVFQQADAMDMSAIDGGTATHPLTSYESGASTGAVELGLAAHISWVDTVSGRAFRNGRSYVGPLPGMQITNGGMELVPGFTSQYASAGREMIDHVDAEGGALVIVHGMSTPNQQLAVVEDCICKDRVVHLDSRRN